MLSPVAEARHLRVLVVDDDQLMLRTLADILRHRGYDATTAATGGAALEQVAAGAHPAVALVDLMLPDMAGMEVVRALRQISRSTEVVVLTGHASLATAVTALREQSYDYLVKPVAPDYLLQTIGKAGERWRRRLADEKFEALLEAAPDAMVIVDESGGIVLVNGQTEALFGYSREEVLGQPMEILVPEGLRESHVRHRSIYASHPEVRTMGSALTLNARRSNGTMFPVEICLSPIHTADGTFFSSAIRDITARVRLEEQLRQSQKMEAIGRLAGGVAHDFNNILTAIIGYAELAAKRPGADAARQDIEQIRRAANRAASLTGQLLAFSRRQPLKPRPLDLSLTVSETAAMLRRLIGEHISLVIENDEPLGMVMADPGQISQVVMNLAVNARDAMPQGGTLRITTRDVEIAARTKEHEDSDVPAGCYVAVSVSDTGVGMDPETRARIFEPFFTTKERGTGLGLATVYGIVNQSGGHITVHSRQGGGTRFTVYLPQAAALPGEDDAAVHDPPPAAPRAAGTILLVEDEEQVRDLAAAALGDLGYLVLSTRNGAEALAALASHRERIDLLLTDVVMQGQLGGIEVAEQVRRARPEVKVLFMSGYVGEGLRSVPGALLAKPFSSRELADEVRKAIGENQVDQALEAPE